MFTVTTVQDFIDVISSMKIRATITETEEGFIIIDLPISTHKKRIIMLKEYINSIRPVTVFVKFECELKWYQNRFKKIKYIRRGK